MMHLKALSLWTTSKHWTMDVRDVAGFISKGDGKITWVIVPTTADACHVRCAHQGGLATTCLLRRVLEPAFEKVLRRVLRRRLTVRFEGRKGSEKGS